MCGRFTQIADSKKLAEEFGIPIETIPPFKSRYNIAPLQPVLVAIKQKEIKLRFLLWGLIPSWAKEPSIASRMINARFETLSERPSFRGPFKNQRCLIPADGFYEWKKEGNRKVPYYIRSKRNELFTFAGLWSHWVGSDGAEMISCTIVTKESNTLMQLIHPRMPAIVPRGKRDAWLDTSSYRAEDLKSVLESFPEDALEAFIVSTRVNDPKYDSVNCVMPKNFELPMKNYA